MYSLLVEMAYGLTKISLIVSRVSIMHLSMVCSWRGAGAGNPREFVLKLLHQGRDFGIDNDPLFVRHFETLSINHWEKLPKEREFDTKFRPKSGEIVLLKTDMSKFPLGYPPPLSWGKPLIGA